MKETLKRDLNKTYLILENENEGYEEGYELEMIMRNAPETILPLQVMRMDGQIALSYDVSSRQTLKEFMLRGNLPGSMITELFRQIVNLEEEIKNYLLDSKCVLLDPEHIYRKDDSFCFCYCPWEKNDVTEMLRKLLEELLGKLDYRDAKGIELAYHLYQKSCGGELDIRKILQEHEEKADSEPEEEKQKVFIHPAEDIKAEKESFWEIPEEQKKQETEEHAENKTGLLGRILKFFLKKEETEEESENEEKYPDAWEEINKLRIPGEEDAFCFGEPPAVYEPFPSGRTEDAEEIRPTELLNGSSATVLLSSITGVIWMLRPLVPGYEEFHITGESFLIGKKREVVDGYIGKETISRIHSRLYVKDERLFIADANSTNGTFVNGEPLPPGADTEIFSGDRVLFADVGYECYNER